MISTTNAKTIHISSSLLQKSTSINSSLRVNHASEKVNDNSASPAAMKKRSSETIDSASEDTENKSKKSKHHDNNDNNDNTASPTNTGKGSTATTTEITSETKEKDIDCSSELDTLTTCHINLWNNDFTKDSKPLVR